LIPDFVTALFKEMDLCAQTHVFGAFDTLYLGGGSPSVLTVKQIETILSHACKTFDMATHSEITIEINPGDVDFNYMQSLRRLGINRINIGIQSFDDGMLTFLGRRHTGRQSREAVQNAEKAGFENMGIDLIYGIPGQGLALWQDTINAALTFNPAHMSCYQLTLEADTPLGRRFADEKFTLPDNDTQYEFFIKTSDTLEAAGYIHYEVSNFAREAERASRHNQKYWDHTPYLGLGPAAHSFLDDLRWWNHRSLVRYRDDLKTGKPPVEDSEKLTPEQLQLETLLLGLRTGKGVDTARYEERFGRNLLEEKAATIKSLIEEGLIRIENGCVRPTRKGLAVADSLALI